VYNDTPNDYIRSSGNEARRVDATYSIGLRARTNDGGVTDVFLDSPAGKAGIGPGMQILAVNGVRFSPDVLRNAIKASKSASGPLMLEVQNDDVVKAVSVNYHGDAREPHLERDMTKPDVLAQILAPRAKK